MSRSSGKVTALTRKQRLAALILGVALNLVALIALIAVHDRSRKPQKDLGTTSISIAGPANRTRSSKPPALKSTSALNYLTPEYWPFSQEEQAMLGQSGESCSILDSVARAIISDPKAVDAIVHAPPETRSIADAIVIWNVSWSASAEAPAGPLSKVRENVTATLEAAPHECLSSPISGPRLVPIANGDQTLFLVFGSGDWSWAALLDAEPIDYWNLPEWLG